MTNGHSRAWLRRSLVALALLVGIAAVAELGSASVAEYRLSRELRDGAGLDTDPEVTIGAFPYLTSGGELNKLSIAVPAHVRDHSARIEAELADVSLPGGLLPSFDAHSPIRARHIESRVRLDQKTVGRYLGIIDLQVHTPAPKRAGAGSPADGYVKSSTGIVLTGTVPLPTQADPNRTELVSVAADFSNQGNAVRITTTGIYSGPEDHAEPDLQPGDEPRVLAAFSGTLPEMALPFGISATGARGENADVVLLGEAEDVTVTPGAFYRPIR